MKADVVMIMRVVMVVDDGHDLAMVKMMMIMVKTMMMKKEMTMIMMIMVSNISTPEI